MDVSGSNFIGGIDWGIYWPAFFLGFSIGAVIFTLAFSLIFLYYRHIMNKTGGFSLRSVFVQLVNSRTKLLDRYTGMKSCKHYEYKTLPLPLPP